VDLEPVDATTPAVYYVHLSETELSIED